MQADHPKASTNGHAGPVEQRSLMRSELDELQATCERQEHVIDALNAAVCTLARRAKALKAENADLRARTERRSPAGERIEARFALDVHAPGAARSVVAECLGERVEPGVLDNALLLATELVSNSVRHSGMPAGAGVVVGVTLRPDSVRIDVDDPGCGGAIAPRPPDPESGGFGLNLVQTLSQRWGVERAVEGGTRVWVQLVCAPASRGQPSRHSRRAAQW